MTIGRLSFERIAVRRAPGFEDGGFELTALSPGVNLVHGPQAVGKSTVGRTIARLLWPEQRAWREHSVAAELRIGDERWLADATHAPPTLQRDGREAGRLPTPGRELADRYSLALHDLLQAQTEEADLARVIDRELAGGFDLDGALAAVGARERPGRPRKLTTTLEAAERRVAEAESEQAALAEEEQSLERLRREEAEARRAGRELAEVRAVLAWRSARSDLAREERVLQEGFPVALERLTGDEEERLADLDRQIEETDRRIEDLRRRIERAEARLEEARLPEGGVPRETLTALDGQRRRLDTLESALSERRSILEGTRRRREESRMRLGDRVDGEVLRGLGPDDWEPFLDLSERGERLRGRRAEVEAVEDWIGEAEAPSEAGRLQEAVGRLRRWLAAPGAAWGIAVPGLLGALLLAGLAWTSVPAGVPDAATGGGGGPWSGLVLWTLGGVAVALVLWLVVALHRGRVERRTAKTEYLRLGFEPPARWSPEAVEERLRTLEQRLAEAGLERAKAARRPELEGRRRRLDRQAAELEKERGELIERLGVAPGLPTATDEAPLAALVRDLCAFRAADEAVREEESVVASREREREEILASAGERLAPFGYPELAAGQDAVADLAGRIDDLRGREETRAVAREALAEAAGPDGALAREEASAERLRRERRELFRRLDLDPDSGGRAGLTRLLDQLPDYREQAERVSRARHDLERARADLPEAEAEASRDGEGAADVLEVPEEELQTRQAELERRADGVEELVRSIGVIEDRVARAKESHNLEDALAAREDALAALGEERERDTDAVVAHELGAWLRDQMRGRRRPAVMKRAARLFARFTAGRFELLDPSGDPPELRALDTAAGRGRSLAELSGGVRLQLLLAVRMAFIEDQEGSVRLPLVMDETLANSDDRTARAIIDAVLELARDGRQIFYLTAQADEVAKWRAALEELEDGPGWEEIDLAEVRHRAEARELPRSAWEPRASSVPEPEGRSREEYAELLGVPGLDPHRGVGAVHLWYLVEETDRLHDLLRSLGDPMARWGQVRALGEGAAAYLGGGGAGEDRYRRMKARAHLLEAAFDGWRQGRGRPVDRGVLLESKAVTETFLDKVSELADALDGDAARLLDALREGRVKRFQTAKIEQLEEYLLAEGYLDERPRLDGDAIRTRALAAVASEVEAGDLDFQDIDELLARVTD